VANPFKEFTSHFTKGETVYNEAEPGAMMYVIQSGVVELYREIEGKRISYGVLERGDFFGEMSLLLESQPRTTGAVVLEDADLVEINATLFDKMIRGNIEIAVRMLRKISLRLREHEERMREESAPGPREPETVAPAVASIPVSPAEPKAPSAAEGEPAPIAVAPPDPSPADGPPLSVSGSEIPSPDEAPASPPPRHQPAPPQPAAPLPSAPPGVHAVFSTQDGGNQFTLISDRAAIGRFDPVTGMRPDVDLSAVDINRSVSRHHARLVRQGSGYNLTEEVGALNGTFINGKRLTTGKPTPLRDGDEVGMGMVRLRFHVLTES